MRQTILDSIRDFTNNLPLLSKETFQTEAEYKEMIKNAKSASDVDKAAFAYLKFIVESPDHKPFIKRSLLRYLLEQDMPFDIAITSHNSANIILELVGLWNAPTFKAAEKHAETILERILQEMYSTSELGLFRLTNNHFDNEGYDRNSVLYKRLLHIALLLPCKILGEKVVDTIVKSLVNKSIIPYFAYKAADILWNASEYAAAAVLFQMAIEATKDSKEWRLSDADYLDAFLTWGVCAVKQNHLETAYDVYSNVINQFANRQGGTIPALENIYTNMAYVCGSLADINEDKERHSINADNEEMAAKYQDAKENYRRQAFHYVNCAIDTNPNDFSNRNTLGTLYDDTNEYDLACSCYEEALKYAKTAYEKLIALRSYIQIRLDQMYDGISIDKTDLIEKISNYSCSFAEAKRYKQKPSNLLEEMDVAEKILAIYNPRNDSDLLNSTIIGEASTKKADIRSKRECDLLNLKEIGLNLLNIYVCGMRIRNCLRYPLVFDASIDNHTKSDDLTPIIAYYTTLSNANYLLNKTEPAQDQLADLNEGDWPDAPKTSDKAQNRLTMMHTSYMNDPNEGHPLIRVLAEELDNGDSKNYLFIGSTHETFRKKLLDEKFVFLKSFTSIVDQLSMWSTYASDRSSGSDSNGCCICIEPRTFQMMQDAQQNHRSQNKNPDKDDFCLYYVAYILKREQMEKGVKKIVTELVIPNMKPARKKQLIKHYNNLKRLFKELNSILYVSPTHQTLSAVWRGLSLSLSFIAFLFKDASYASEKELRLIVTRNKSNRSQIQHTGETPPKLFVMPPHQIFVKEIILGPKVQSPDHWIPHLQFQLAEMWESWPENYGDPPIPKVRKSSISYRD